MTDNYKTKSTALLGRLFLFVMLLMAGMSASAADPVDGGELELDKEYTNPKFTKTIYTFTAPKDGVITITATKMSGDKEVPSSDCPQVFSDEAMQNRISNMAVTGTETATLTAGTKYYIQAKWSMKEYKWKATMDGNAGLTITGMSPEEGKTFDITSTTGLHVEFNMAVTADKTASLTCGSQSVDTIEVSPLNNTLNLEPRNTIYAWVQKGLVKPGDKMTFKITGVHAASDENMKYGEDGTLTLEYLAPSIPTMLAKETVPATFKSFWAKGDKDGIVVLEFDHDLMPVGTKGDDGKDQQTAVATLGMGNIEGGPYYTETLSPDNGKLTIEGNKLMVDLTDSLRTIESMGLDQNYGTISLKISYVKSADGVNVYSPGQGTFGSFGYTLPYEEVVSNIASEFTPATKSSIADVDNIEIYLSDKTAVTYSGVKFAWTADDKAKEVVVANKDITVKDEGQTGVSLTVPVPAEAKTAQNVTVTLADAVFIDGQNHDISALYNYAATLQKDFMPVSVTPADGSVAADLSSVKVSFGEAVVLNSAVETPAEFVDMTNRGVIVNGKLAIDAKDNKTVTVTPESALEDTHSYRLVIKEGAIGNNEYATSNYATGRTNPQLTYNFVLNKNVAAAPFITDPIDGATVSELSTILFKSNNGKEISPSWITNRHIYLKDAKGAYVAEAKPELGDDNYTVKAVFDKPFTVSGEYTLEVQDSVFIYGTGFDVDANVTTNIKYTVEGTTDPSVEYTFGAPVSTDPADQTQIEKLENITLTFDKDVKPSPFQVVKVYDRANRQVVNTGYLKASKTDSKSLVVVLDSALTVKKTYSVEIMQGAYGDAAWADGNYLAGQSNEALVYYYEVVGNAPVEPSGDVVTDPADGSTVKSLKDIIITFKNNTDCAPSYSVYPQLLDAEGNVVCGASTEFGDPSSWDPQNYCQINLEQEITAAGTYTLDIPAGVFILDGVDSPAMKFTYTVSPEDAINGVFGDDAAAKADVFNLSGVRVLHNATKADFSKLARGIYIVNGKKVVVK